MNQLNYASLETSKRLVDAGTVLETEASWMRMVGKDTYKLAEYHSPRPPYCIPAPSMAELWRELPGTIWIENVSCHLEVEKYGTGLVCCYINECLGVTSGRISNTNPTDALIDLLIWVRKEKP